MKGGVDGVVALYYVPKNALFHLMFDAREGLYRSLDVDLHQVLIFKNNPHLRGHRYLIPQRQTSPILPIKILHW